MLYRLKSKLYRKEKIQTSDETFSFQKREIKIIIKYAYIYIISILELVTHTHTQHYMLNTYMCELRFFHKI